MNIKHMLVQFFQRNTDIFDTCVDSVKQATLLPTPFLPSQNGPGTWLALSVCIEIKKTTTHSNQKDSDVSVDDRYVEEPQCDDHTLPYHGEKDDEYDVTSSTVSERAGRIDVRDIVNVWESCVRGDNSCTDKNDKCQHLYSNNK